MTPPDADPWRPVLDAHSTLEDVDRLTAQWTRLAMDDLRDQLDRDPEWLTPRDVAQLLLKAEPLIAQRTRDTFTTAWLRLSRAATDGAIH